MEDCHTIFAKLQISAKTDDVGNNVMRPSGKVHITNGTLGDHETSQHLGQVVGGNTVTESRQQNGALPDELELIPIRHRGGGQLTTGAMMIPTIKATTYAQAGRVMFSLITTTRPRMKEKTRTAMYHHQGASL